MLRITQQSSATGAKSYYSQADYLSEGQERSGRWGGRAAQALGLQGLVQQEPFDRLCDNERPTGNGTLTERTRTNRTVGYDWTFNAPKSLSVLYGLTNDAQLLGAFRDAVDATMREAEQAMQTRVRKQGVEQDRTTGNMLWAEFTHTTARPVNGLPDPHLHSHVFVFNATFDGHENAWKAGQFRDLKRDARYYEAAFHARLAKNIADLGYGVERTRTGWEIAGVAPRVQKEFSRRTALIEAKAQAKGITDPDQKASLGATTREAKDHTLSYPELQQIWRDRLTEAERAALQRLPRERTPALDTPAHTPTVSQAAKYALAHCFTTTAVIPAKELLATALRHGVGAATPESMRTALQQQGAFFREHDGRVWASTHAVLAQEKALIAGARCGRGTRAALKPEPHVFTCPYLNTEQKTAVQHVLHSQDQVTLIRGAAGTGKTTLMREAVAAIEATGRAVAVLAPSVEASRGVLRTDGFADANTVAHFLQDEAMQTQSRGGVIWIDEAGLLPLQQAQQVFALAQQLDARLVLSGDRRQHTSVERGDVLKLLEDEAGLPQARVTTIQRQEQRGYKEAVQAFSEGRTLLGLQKLEALGWVHEIADTATRERQIATDYVQAVAELRDPAHVLVIAPSHAEKNAVTAAIRSVRHERGELGVEHLVQTWQPVHLTEAQRGDRLSYEPGMMLQFHKAVPGHRTGSRMVVHEGSVLPLEHPERFTVYRPQELALAEGDRVRVTGSMTTTQGKHRLSRGALYTIKAFAPDGAVVLNNGWTLPASGLHLDHGYCLTSHASQGKTVQRVLLAQSSVSAGAASPEQAYVSASRAKQRVTVYTDSHEQLRDALADPRPRLSAQEFQRLAQPRSRFAQWRERHAHLRRLRAYERYRSQPEPPRERHYDRSE